MGGRRAGCGRHIALTTVASIMLIGCSVGGVRGSASLNQPKTPEPKISLADEPSKDPTPPPPPRPVRLPPLPETGIVVGHGKVVDLHALDGERVHRLKGFRLHGHDETMRVSMTRKGFAYELFPRRNLLRPRLKKIIRLRPAGRLKAIENDKGRPAGYTLHAGDGTQHHLSKKRSVWVSPDRTELAFPSGGKRRPGFTMSAATGERRPLPRGCRVGAVVQEKWIGICNRGRKGEAAADAWLDILAPDGTTTELVPPPDHEGHLIGGHWRSVTPSPDGACCSLSGPASAKYRRRFSPRPQEASHARSRVRALSSPLRPQRRSAGSTTGARWSIFERDSAVKGPMSPGSTGSAWMDLRR